MRAISKSLEGLFGLGVSCCLGRPHLISLILVLATLVPSQLPESEHPGGSPTPGYVWETKQDTVRYRKLHIE